MIGKRPLSLAAFWLRTGPSDWDRIKWYKILLGGTKFYKTLYITQNRDKKSMNPHRRLQQWTKQILLFTDTSTFQRYYAATCDPPPQVVLWGELPAISVYAFSKRQFDRYIREWKGRIFRWCRDNPIDWSDSKCATCNYRGYYKCSCFQVAYCCRPCQLKHWPEHQKSFHQNS